MTRLTSRKMTRTITVVHRRIISVFACCFSFKDLSEEGRETENSYCKSSDCNSQFLPLLPASASGRAQAAEVVSQRLRPWHFPDCALQLNVAVGQRRASVFFAKCRGRNLVANSPTQPIGILVDSCLVGFWLFVRAQKS